MSRVIRQWTSRTHAYIILTPPPLPPTPSNPILYSITGDYRDIHYFSHFLLKNLDCGYSLEILTNTQNLGFEQKYKTYQSFLSENFQFLEVKFSIHLKRFVFVMTRNTLKSKSPDQHSHLHSLISHTLPAYRFIRSFSTYRERTMTTVRPRPCVRCSICSGEPISRDRAWMIYFHSIISVLFYEDH